MKINHLTHRLFLTPLALVALLAAGCSPTGTNDAIPSGMRVLPQAELEKALLPSGDEKAVLVNFWATWCKPCLKEMPELVALREEWQAKGVRVQTVAIDVQVPQGKVRTVDDIVAFMQKRRFVIPVISPAEKSLFALSEKYGLNGGIPVTLVIDSEGEIVARHEGSATRKMFERMIERAL